LSSIRRKDLLFKVSYNRIKIKISLGIQLPTSFPELVTEYLTQNTLSARLHTLNTTFRPIYIPRLQTTILRILRTMRILPRNASVPPTKEQTLDLVVFPTCGYVLKPPKKRDRLTSCPKCQATNRMVRLRLQTAPTFLLDAKFTHVLPCGHMTSLELGLVRDCHAYAI
jgi:hypothetical protein